MSRYVSCLAVIAWLAAALLAPDALAQSTPLDAKLREQIISVTKPGFMGPTLEVTLFSPPGDGPFPVAVINHGKASGDPRWQARARYSLPSRSLVERGFLGVFADAQRLLEINWPLQLGRLQYRKQWSATGR